MPTIINIKFMYSLRPVSMLSERLIQKVCFSVVSVVAVVDPIS